MHKHDEEGPPCRHMEKMLQDTASGQAGRFRRWFAELHAAGCPRCGRFLRSLREMVSGLRKAKESPEDQAALERLSHIVQATSSE